MNRFALCSGVLFVGALLPVAGAGTPVIPAPLQGDVIPEDAIFPVPSEDLVIQIGGDATPSLADVLKSFEDIAAHNLHVSTETWSMLKNVTTGLSKSVIVPAKEVYAYVETLLADSGFLMAETRRAEPRLISVYSLQTHERSLVRSRARAISLDEVYRYERHPALLVQVVLGVDHVDARQLSNSMRQLMNDPNVEQAIPLSEGSLLLVGTGPRVSDWIQLIRTADANAMPEEVVEPPAPGGNG